MSDMSELFGLLNAAAGQHAAGSLQFVLGEVESWDPDQGTVVVTTKPGDNLTGDIPFMTPCVGAKGPDGKASGMQWGPAKGTPVVVFTTDSAQEHLYAMAQHYNDVFPSPGALEGEWWIRHKGGAYVKLLNDGRVVIGSATHVDISDTTTALGSDDCIVRRADLQAVIDKLNTLTDWCRDHMHPGTAPAILPYPLAPLTIPQWCPDATASSRGRAKGE